MSPNVASTSVSPNPLSPKQIAAWAALVSPGTSRQDNFSPLDGSLIASLPQATPEGVASAFERARIAAVSWAKTPLRHRARIMLRLHDLVLDHQKTLLDVVQWETGKSRGSAFDEVADVALNARYYAHSARRHLSPQRRTGVLPLVSSAQERYIPHGVVGMITPWNYPLTLPISDAIPALLAGNAVVVKPDAKTPLSLLGALELLIEAGLPQDLFQVVLGDGPTIGSAIINNADFVMFTGSTATGKLIAASCGARMVGFSAELGGKNPMIVLEDAPLERAIQGAISACFSNAGQLCVSIERIYIHEGIYDQFVPRFISAVKKLRLGSTLDFDYDVGSLISQDQLDKVLYHLKDATAKGATVLAGGKHRPEIGPYVCEPTVLENVSEDMALCRSETFGPVVALYRVASDEEAIARANDTTYGLNASVWGSKKHATTVARRIEAGSVNVNEGFTASWASTDAPMGGVKESGMGRRHGREGIIRYTNIQTIATQRLLNVGPPQGMGPEGFAKTMSLGLRVLKYLPLRD